MNSNTAEEKIKTIVEQMDTLQAGIVYGKEDAWDRLQARLDAKPVPKQLPWYKTTAVAAALLLLAGSGYLVTNYRGDLSSGIYTAYNGALSVNRHVSLPNKPAALPTPPAIQDTYTLISVSTAPLPRPPKQKTQEEPIQAVVTEIERIPEQTLQPARAPAPKMKVVHINDLGQQEDNTAHYAWEERNPFPHVQFRMKVIHINDIGRPLTQEEYMRNAEKAAVLRLPFGRKNGLDNNIDENKSLFRINLSQN